MIQRSFKIFDVNVSQYRTLSHLFALDGGENQWMMTASLDSVSRARARAKAKIDWLRPFFTGFCHEAFEAGVVEEDVC